MGSRLSRARRSSSPSAAAKGASTDGVSYSWTRIVKGTVRHKHVLNVEEMLNALRSATEVSSTEFNIADGIKMRLALFNKDVKTSNAVNRGKPRSFFARNILPASTSPQKIGRIPKQLGFKIYCLDANNDIFNLKISLLKEGSDKNYFTHKVKKTLSAGDSFELNKYLSTKMMRNRTWRDQDHFFVKESTFTIVCEVAVSRMGILTVGNSKTNVEEVAGDKSLAANLLSLQNTDTSDVVLLSASGKKFPVHSFILKARSRELAKCLDSAEPKKEIQLHKKLRDDVIDALIEFMYSDAIPNGLDVPLALRLLRAAHLYTLEGLKATAEEFLVSKLDPNSAVDFLRIGHKTSSSLLISKAAEIIADKYDEFRVSAKWAQLKKELPDVASYVLDKGMGKPVR